MQNKVLLAIGAVLIFVGVFKPSLDNFNIIPNREPAIVETYVVDAPSNPELLEKANVVIDILKSSDDSTRPQDCLKLSSLYADMATLIELDQDEVIKDTENIRQANSLAGRMLNLNIKNKYPNLSEAARGVVIQAIGDDDLILIPELRTKAAESFRALSWAFYEGSK
jgi:hypothetical protein